MSEQKKSLKENIKEIFDGALTVPNLLSAIRICLIPVFAVLYYKSEYLAAVVVLALSGISDFLDGKIARKFNQVSNLGKMLDPIADKLTIFAVAICLYLKFKSANDASMQAFAWVFLLFIVKEFVMIFFGAIIVALGARPVPAAIYGKIATFLFFLVMALIIAFGPEIGALNQYFTLNSTVMYVLVIIALVMTFVAFLSYVPGAAKQILGKDKAPKEKK